MGPKPETFTELLNSVYELLYNHDSYIQKRLELNHFFNEIQHECCSGICEKVKEYIIK
ncbi:MAG: hypothetical protein SOW34_03940 [Oliverpabstia sp.]|nr:hypothetical protein [Oliverpabstia sp.]